MGAETADLKDQLVRQLKTRSMRTGDFVLSSGRRSSHYIDARLTTMSAIGQDLIGRMGHAAVRGAGWQAVAIGGLTLGADPVSYAIARASLGTPLPLDAFTVRKEPKGHGTGRQIEGCFNAGDRVVVAEDVITSGGSALRAVEAIERAGGSVCGVIAVVDREEGGRTAIEDAGHAVLALSTLSDLGIG